MQHYTAVCNTLPLSWSQHILGDFILLTVLCEQIVIIIAYMTLHTRRSCKLHNGKTTVGGGVLFLWKKVPQLSRHTRTFILCF